MAFTTNPNITRTKPDLAGKTKIMTSGLYPLSLDATLLHDLRTACRAILALLKGLLPIVTVRGWPEKGLDKALGQLDQLRDTLAGFTRALPTGWVDQVESQAGYDAQHRWDRQIIYREKQPDAVMLDKVGVTMLIRISLDIIQGIDEFLARTDFSTACAKSDLDRVTTPIDQMDRFLARCLNLPSDDPAALRSTASLRMQQLVLELCHARPTDDQRRAALGLSRFAARESPADIFILRGYAGTGKSTLIGALVGTLSRVSMNVALLAPTGRAAKVLSRYAQRSASTIHHGIYELLELRDDEPSFKRREHTFSNTLFIIDEASMIPVSPRDQARWGPKGLLQQLLSFVFSGNQNRILFVGDDAQLPPVGDNESYALSSEYLQKLGYRVETATLREVVRQQRGGPLELATALRTLLAARSRVNGLRIPVHSDLRCLVQSDVIAQIRQEISRVGLENVCVLSRTKRETAGYNQQIRREVLGYEQKLVPGERVIVCANNYAWVNIAAGVDFLANGEIAVIKSLGQIEPIGPFHFCQATIQFESVSGSKFQLSGKILLNSLENNGPLSPSQHRHLRKMVDAFLKRAGANGWIDLHRRDSYLNALQIIYGYALTAHKAQGGQWRSVFVDLDGWKRWSYQNPITALRWLYTAVTRTTKSLFLVGLPSGAKILP